MPCVFPLSGVTPVLLARGMAHLLELANPAISVDTRDQAEIPSEEELSLAWKCQVHALNVLRLVLIDATLARDVLPYITQATRSAISGFEHPVWAVRNSCMMLFAAIIQRGVGGPKNAPDTTLGTGESERRPHTPKSAMTAHAFFRLHPKLEPFLLQQLERAADEGACREHEAAARDDFNALNNMHPVLYPVLLLLARLRCEDFTSSVDQGDGEDQTRPTLGEISPFVPVVMRCGSKPHYHVRVAASRALAVLVPPSQVPHLLAELLRGLQQRTIDGWQKMPGIHNYIHGTLLQVLELIEVGRGVTMTSAVETGGHDDSPSSVWLYHFASNAGKTLVELAWLADPSQCRCPPVRFVMILVMECTESLLEQCVKTAREMSWCLAKVKAALFASIDQNFDDAVGVHPSNLPVPGRSQLVLKAVHSKLHRDLDILFSTEIPRDKISGQNNQLRGKSANQRRTTIWQVVELLRHTDQDIRRGTITALNKFLEHVGSARNASSTDWKHESILLIWQIVIRELVSEADVSVKGELLCLLSRLGSLLDMGGIQTVSAKPHCEAVESLWHYLRSVCEESHGSGGDLHAFALRLMGIVLRLGDVTHVTTRLSDSKVRVAEVYIGILECAVDPEQSAIMRVAAAASLASSGLLYTRTNPPNGDTCTDTADTEYVRVWFVAIRLLQDDDEDARECTARACANALQRVKVQGAAAVQEEGISTFSARGSLAPSLQAEGCVYLRTLQEVFAHFYAFVGSQSREERLVHFFVSRLFGLLGTIARSGERGLSESVSTPCNRDETVLATFSDHRKSCHPQRVCEIFESEQHHEVEEPALFVFLAAPFLGRILSKEARVSKVLPPPCVEAIVEAVDTLGRHVRFLSRRTTALPELTWQSGTFISIMVSTLVGMNTLRFLAEFEEWGTSTGAAEMVSGDLLLQIKKDSETLVNFCREASGVRFEVAQALEGVQQSVISLLGEDDARHQVGHEGTGVEYARVTSSPSGPLFSQRIGEHLGQFFIPC